MAQNYAYNYATIDPETNMCVDVQTTTYDCSGNPDYGTYLIELEVCDPEYLFKYYINGEWYEDAEGTIPWRSALLGE